MGQLEIIFERRFVAKLRGLPNSWWPDKLTATSFRAMPDSVGVINGHYVALEFKAREITAKAKTGAIVLQRHRLKKITDAGGIGHIVHPGNRHEVYEQLERLANGNTVS